MFDSLHSSPEDEVDPAPGGAQQATLLVPVLYASHDVKLPLSNFEGCDERVYIARRRRGCVHPIHRTICRSHAQGSKHE